ncbi:LacI family transcriptional regulator [Arthrobacter silviterrae]|uniref:LacI family transcriptional regulator n=1 Tax=Arthrobacter silviterrae TaxID=2026658 RepID=A0ABX0DCN7_9MICC|nr:LacI family DNA-binding transcriptional regulator [Arthrobacter silviterrae]MDQ0276475.1 LacI family transcriptional regulator [Arthrobacter silviterrae]NGN84687.1 LacI family transcriptional regulator [Arthrobacter silviterrae]
MTGKKSTRATREDVARQAGTSVAVVSYVVNGGPRPVAEATRDRVLAAIDSVGYSPNGIAKALASGVSGAYGLIVPDISNPFFAALAHELEEAVAAEGKVLLLGDSAESKEREETLLKLFLQRQIDGILFIGVDSKPDVRAALRAGVQLVILDRVDNDAGVSSVAVDNIAGSYAATNHLIGHGYTRIGIISGPGNLYTARDRNLGWETAMAQAQLEVDPRWRLEENFSRHGGREAGRRLFSLPQLPEAVFASNEQQAVGLLAAAAEFGVRVPEDLAIMTFDGTDDSEYATPAISTVVQPLNEIARVAVNLLARPPGHEVVQHECDFTLRLRPSCGPHAGQPVPDHN